MKTAQMSSKCAKIYVFLHNFKHSVQFMYKVW